MSHRWHSTILSCDAFFCLVSLSALEFFDVWIFGVTELLKNLRTGNQVEYFPLVSPKDRKKKKKRIAKHETLSAKMVCTLSSIVRLYYAISRKSVAVHFAEFVHNAMPHWIQLDITDPKRYSGRSFQPGIHDFFVSFTKRLQKERERKKNGEEFRIWYSYRDFISCLHMTFTCARSWLHRGWIGLDWFTFLVAARWKRKKKKFNTKHK